MKFSMKLILGLLVLLAFTNARPRRMQAVKPAEDNHADKKDTDDHHKDLSGAGHAEAAGTIHVDADSKGAKNKNVAHGELEYLKPQVSHIDKCDKEHQIGAGITKDSPDLCANYVDKKWNGFIMDPKAQEAAFPDLVKFAKKYGNEFWGKDIDYVPEFAQKKYDPYVFDIGLCTSKLWSQNLINNKIIFNWQLTDYEDVQYTKCARYDQLARSCLIGSANPDQEKNSCLKWYQSQSAKFGEFKHIDNGRLRRRMETEQAYDDLVTQKMLNGEVKTTRKGKFYEKAASKIEKAALDKEGCLKKVLEAPECNLFKHMMPAAIQAEVKQVTYLHKTTSACLPCEKCKSDDGCPKCPTCHTCNCKSLTDWEIEALHLAIAVNGESGEAIKSGVVCDTTVMKPIADAVKMSIESRQALVSLMQTNGPNLEGGANKESASNLLPTLAMAGALLMTLLN